MMSTDFVLYQCDDCGLASCDDHETICHCSGPKGTWTEILVVRKDKIKELEAENQKLREQRDAANAHIQFLNRVITGDAE